MERLTPVFSKSPDIQAVYLFGTAASGRTYNESDADLAIVVRADAEPFDRLSMLADLTRFGLRDIDLVILDTDDIVLKHESVRQNHVIYQAEDFDCRAYASMVTRQYLDFLPYLKVQRNACKAKILFG